MQVGSFDLSWFHDLRFPPPPSSSYRLPSMPDPTRSLPRVVADYLSVETRVCTVQDRSAGYSLDPRTLHDHNFIYVDQGRVVWQINGTDYPARTGDLLRVPRHLPHLAWSTTQTVRVISIHVYPYLPGGQDAFDLVRPPILLPEIGDTELADWFRMTRRHLTSGQPSEHGKRFMPGYGHLVTHGYLVEAETRGELQPLTLDPVVQEVLAWVHRSVETPLSLDKLAAHAGFSPQYLNRLFVKTFGVTPLKIRQRLRLERAAELLKTTNFTAAAIGEQLYFNDPTHFSRAFKNHFGRGPAEYRSVSTD